MKTTLMLMLTGALLGIVAASYIVPPALSWYTSPGGLPAGAQIQAIVKIPEVIQYATAKLMRGQFYGACVGAVAGLVLGLVLASNARKRRAAERAVEEAEARASLRRSGRD